MVWKKYGHETPPPKDIGCWCVGSTRFKITKVNSPFQALALDGLFERNIQRALMNNPGEPYAMWDYGASFL
eukprot:2220976-Prorocentrum_lima.AAC.1